MTSASRATAAQRPPRTGGTARPRVAVLSDRPQAILEAARDAGIAADCADAATLWLLPYNAPRMLLLDLPVAGVTPRRLALLLRQLGRACPDLVIAAHRPTPGLPCDIDLPGLSDDDLADAFSEALHLLRPHPRQPPSPFHPTGPKRHSLFR